jgi:S-adenosylmethionine:tRNA ribosyltransferase-isomerase
MKLTSFKFEVPKELIALYPTKDRDGSEVDGAGPQNGKIEHKKFKNVLDYFDEGDTFILNNTKVFPARMWGNKEKTGAKIEVFMLRELNRDSLLWDVIVDPARKIRIGNKLYFGKDDELVAEVIDNTTSRGRTLRFLFDGTTRSSSVPSPRWAKRRCRTTSSATWKPAMRTATRPSTPSMKGPWPHPPQACTSAAS